MSHNPLAQFELKTLIPIIYDGYDLSFTNSSLLMVCVLAGIVLFFGLATRKLSMVPSRIQVAAEILYNMVCDMLQSNVGPEGKKFMPLIFSIFLFILICNVSGMLPYSFTVTSHVIVTFVLAMIVFLTVTIVGFIRHGSHFLSLFLPKGTPWWMAPLMIAIELLTFLARPITLSLRLTANMMAGHIMIKVIAGFVITGMFLVKPLPIPLIVVLIGFEIFIAVLQAYIFTILSCVYLNDAVNLH